MFIGIGFLSMLTAAIASTFVSHDTDKEKRETEAGQSETLEILRRIERRLDALEAEQRSI